MTAFLLAFALLAHAEIPEMSAPPVASVTVRSTPEATLEARLRAERARQIARLEAYAAAGRFPRNPSVPGFSHQFLDASGTPCAVANLIWQSGHADLVRETARTHNDVVLSDVHDGPLADWILTSGLTREEIAVIQAPAYMPPVPTVNANVAEVARIRAHLASTIALLRADTDASIDVAVQRLAGRADLAMPES
jgi:hypothetical protein